MVTKQEMLKTTKVGESSTKRCPTCGKHIAHEDLIFCSGKCKSIYELEQKTAQSGNKELDQLMDQYRRGNWTEVDGKEFGPEPRYKKRKKRGRPKAKKQGGEEGR